MEAISSHNPLRAWGRAAPCHWWGATHLLPLTTPSLQSCEGQSPLEPLDPHFQLVWPQKSLTVRLSVWPNKSFFFSFFKHLWTAHILVYHKLPPNVWAPHSVSEVQPPTEATHSGLQTLILLETIQKLWIMVLEVQHVFIRLSIQLAQLAFPSFSLEALACFDKIFLFRNNK